MFEVYEIAGRHMCDECHSNDPESAFEIGRADAVVKGRPVQKRKFYSSVWADYDNGFREALADQRAAEQARSMAPPHPGSPYPFPKIIYDGPMIDPFNPGDH
jgi:hypothetical protein